MTWHNRDPSRYLVWVNKPERNHILAEFTGFMSEVPCFVLNSSTQQLVVGCKDALIRTLDANTGELVRDMESNVHMEGITCLALSPSGTRLASGGHDHLVVVWDVTTGVKQCATDLHESALTALVFHPRLQRGGSQVLLSASLDMSLRLWSLSADDELKMLWVRDWLSTPVLCACFSDDGNLCVPALSPPPRARRLSPRSHTLPPSASAVTGSSDGKVDVWEASAPNLGLVALFKFSPHRLAVLSVAFRPSSNDFAAGSADGTVSLWQLGDEVTAESRAEPLGELTGHQAAVTCVCWSPTDLHRLATTSLDKKVVLWDTESCAEVRALLGHADAVYKCVFDAGRLFSAGFDKTVKVRVRVRARDTGCVASSV